MKKYTWIYLASYLSIGGAGFVLAPGIVLDLFFSNADYGDVMPRVTGIFMLALGGLIALMTRNNDFRYYNYSIYIRTIMVVFFGWLFMRTADPLFITILVIVCVGLIPSWIIHLQKA